MHERRQAVEVMMSGRNEVEREERWDAVILAFRGGKEGRRGAMSCRGVEGAVIARGKAEAMKCHGVVDAVREGRRGGGYMECRDRDGSMVEEGKPELVGYHGVGGAVNGPATPEQMTLWWWWLWNGNGEWG